MELKDSTCTEKCSQPPVKNLNICNFRNIKELNFSPGEKLNVIYGDNARGKTNLIESIWMVTGEKSFRRAKDCDLVMFGENKAEISLDFFANQRIQNATIKWMPRKSIYLNYAKVETVADYLGTFSAIVFSPEDLNLVKNGPEKRRNFLDTALSQLKPRYYKLLLEYNKILYQRNTLLKNLKCQNVRLNSSLISSLDIWDGMLSKISANMTKFRCKYISRFVPVAQEIYSGISGSKEKLKIKYLSSVDLKFGDDLDLSLSFDELSQRFFEKIVSLRDFDIKMGFSQVGPHRDDFDIEINDFSVKNFGSQGQQRSVVLTLKLAEAEILKNLASKNPVILLDDVMSELDFYRKRYILKFLKDCQCFITCCDKNYFKNIDHDLCLYKISDLF